MVVDPHKARMLDLTGSPSLVHESADIILALREFWKKDLDCNALTDGRMICLVDGPHPAGPDLPEHPVPADGRRHARAARSALPRFLRRPVRAPRAGRIPRAAAPRTTLRVAGRAEAPDCPGRRSRPRTFPRAAGGLTPDCKAPRAARGGRCRDRDRGAARADDEHEQSECDRQWAGPSGAPRRFGGVRASWVTTIARDTNQSRIARESS